MHMTGSKGRKRTFTTMVAVGNGNGLLGNSYILFSLCRTNMFHGIEARIPLVLKSLCFIVFWTHTQMLPMLSKMTYLNFRQWPCSQPGNHNSNVVTGATMNGVH